MTDWAEAEKHAKTTLGLHESDASHETVHPDHCSVCQTARDFLALLEENERLRARYARSHGFKQDARIKAALALLESSDPPLYGLVVKALKGGDDAE